MEKYCLTFKNNTIRSDKPRELYNGLLRIISTLNINEYDIVKINSFFNTRKNYIICAKSSNRHKELKKKMMLNTNNYNLSMIQTYGNYVFFVNFSSEEIIKNIYKFIKIIEELKLIEKNILKFEIQEDDMNDLNKIIGTNKDKHNVIIFGAPGTGKSHEIEQALKNAKINENFIFRTTFYEDYSYYDFIGQYKPIVLYSQETRDQRKYSRSPTGEGGNESFGEPNISYEFISGVFIDAYIQAKNNKGKEVFLIIEEINRGNSSAIFGEFFQSLDRDIKESGLSKYNIKISNELSLYLTDKTKEEHNQNFRIPSNLKIIATMNTSDQSLFKMDSAFKRRWSMKYSPISYDNIKNVKIENSNVSYSDFLKKINDMILSKLNNEDKMIGQYFCSISDNKISANDFKDKILHYLFFDVFRFNREEVFSTESFSELYSKKIDDIIKTMNLF